MNRLENQKDVLIVDDLVEPLNKMIAEIGIGKLMKHQNSAISHGKEYQCGGTIKVEEVWHESNISNRT